MPTDGTDGAGSLGRLREAVNSYGSPDKTDEKILRILRDNARESFVDIAKSIGLKEASVRRRVRNMKRNGIIRRFTVEMGEGNVTQAIVLISIESAMETSGVSGNLIAVPGVRIVYEITGQYDITTVISGRNIAEINSTIDAVRKIPGVTDTNSVIILRTYS